MQEHFLNAERFTQVEAVDVDGRTLLSNSVQLPAAEVLRWQLRPEFARPVTTKVAKGASRLEVEQPSK